MADEISRLKAKIDAYEEQLGTATTEAMQIALLNAITAARQELHDLRALQAPVAPAGMQCLLPLLQAPSINLLVIYPLSLMSRYDTRLCPYLSLCFLPT
jgi:hypothetical protein